MSKKNYIAVSAVIGTDELDELRRFAPGDRVTISDEKEIERLLKKGAIEESDAAEKREEEREARRTAKAAKKAAKKAPTAQQTQPKVGGENK